MKPYEFNLRKITEARRGLVKSILTNDKKDIRRWARLLESNAKQLIDLLTEQINDEGKLEQGTLFTAADAGKSKRKKGNPIISDEEWRAFHSSIK